MKTVVPLVRLVVTTCAVATAVALTWCLTGEATTQLVAATRSGRLTDPAWTLDRLAGDIAGMLCLAAAGGLAVIFGLAATAVLTHRSAPRLAEVCARLTPSVSRRLVVVCCGLGMVAPLTLAGPSLASPAGTGSASHEKSCDVGCPPRGLRLGGLELPDLPMPRENHNQHRHQHQLVVHPGDSLWLIARHRLPAGAPDHDIADLTERLYTLNRSTIGANPDLISPGMILLAPEGRS